MLSTWCEWHPYARQFLLGAAYLNMGEEEKAVDLFISASAGIPADRSEQIWRISFLVSIVAVLRSELVKTSKH